MNTSGPDPDLVKAERRLAGLSDAARGSSQAVCYANPPEECDICGRNLEQATLMVDGARKDTGEWACMCAVCFAVCGSGVRWGQGQLYLRRPNGDWLLVGGFPPEHDSGQ